MTVSNRRTEQTPGERGLALLDVLLGMAIFALVAVIAVQSMGMFRDKTYVTRALSDAKQLATGIEAAHIADNAYPTRVTKSASNVRGVNLTTGSWVGGYRVVGENFRACVLSGEGTTTKAYAIFDSVKGAVIESGAGTSAAECDGTGVGNPPVDADGDGEEDVDSTIPTVSVVAVPGETKATVSWNEIVGATSYSVYLDGGATPAWTGIELTTVLTSLSSGDHTVKVSATAGSIEGTKSDPTSFTIYGDNDFLRFAHPVDMGASSPAWTSVDYDESAASIEPGEPGGGALGLWWTFKAPRTGPYNLEGIAPLVGTKATADMNFTVWQSNATTVDALGAATATGSGNMTMLVEKDKTYKIRVSVSWDGHRGKYRLQVSPGPANDVYSEAIAVGSLSDGPYVSPDLDNSFTGPAEPGETGYWGRGLWWTFVAPHTGSYNIAEVAPAVGAKIGTDQDIRVWQSNAATTAGLPGGAHAGGSGNLTMLAQAGQTYKIRVGVSWDGYRGKYRLQVTPGPVNDAYSEAITVGDGAWTSPNVDNTYTGPAEPGEPGYWGRGVWYTFKPTVTGAYNFAQVEDSTGAMINTDLEINVWEGNPATTAGLGAMHASGSRSVTMLAEAGKTYKVRYSLTWDGYKGKFRAQVTPGPVNDAYVSAVTVGALGASGWTSADVDNTNTVTSAAEPGESGDWRRGVWYTFVAPATRSYRIEQIAPSAGAQIGTDLILAAWQTSGATASTLPAQAANGSKVMMLDAEAGKTYKIRAGVNWDGYRGAFRIKVSAP